MNTQYTLNLMEDAMEKQAADQYTLAQIMRKQASDSIDIPGFSIKADEPGLTEGLVGAGTGGTLAALLAAATRGKVKVPGGTSNLGSGLLKMLKRAPKNLYGAAAKTSRDTSNALLKELAIRAGIGAGGAGVGAALPFAGAAIQRSAINDINNAKDKINDWIG